MNDFKQRLLIQVIGGLITAILIFCITLPFKNTLEQLTNLATSIEKSVSAITEAANIDPEKIKNVASAAKNGSEMLGEGVGTGAAATISKIRDALNKIPEK